MVRRIAIVSGLQVIDNPRVVKEADALAELGYEVTVLSAVHRAADVPRIESMVQDRQWRHLPVVDVTKQRGVSRIQLLALRGIARVVRDVCLRLGVEHPLQLGFETIPLLRAARQLNADLYSLHLEKALWVGTKLIAEGRPVRIDIEDWYSEDGLAADRAKQPVTLMRAAESLLLNRAVHSTATSEAMADALVSEFHCRRPIVVYNSFPGVVGGSSGAEKLDRKESKGRSITWVSQTIGPGRGLETLVAAFERLPRDTELHLRGTPRQGYVECLLEGLPADARARIYVHPQVPQEELCRRLAEHDIGYCGELSDCKNKDVTISNKMFEYMRSGLAIVASDTAGQVEVARRTPLAVRVFTQRDTDGLLRVLKPLIEDSEELAKAKGASALALNEHFSWEESKARIQEQVISYFASLDGVATTHTRGASVPGKESPTRCQRE